jgi:hypothetical protein
MGNEPCQRVLKEPSAAWPLETTFPFILAFSLGEECFVWPAWKSKAALTQPVTGILAKRATCLPFP